MNILLIILIINLNFVINAKKIRHQNDYQSEEDYSDNYSDDYSDDYSNDYSPVNAKPVPNKNEQQIDKLQDEIDLRNSYIARLEQRIFSLQNQLQQQQQEDSHNQNTDRAINYAPIIVNSKKTNFPHDSEKEMTDKEMIDKIIPQVSARMPEANCMRSCNYIKDVKAAKDPLSQYMYLMVCAEGCRKSIPCLNENFCMPVMKENPGFFVQCINNCELFKIAPKVFKSNKCK